MRLLLSVGRILLAHDARSLTQAVSRTTSASPEWRVHAYGDSGQAASRSKTAPRGEGSLIPALRPMVSPDLANDLAPCRLFGGELVTTGPRGPTEGHLRCVVSFSLPLEAPPRPLRGSSGASVSPRMRQSPGLLARSRFTVGIGRPMRPDLRGAVSSARPRCGHTLRHSWPRLDHATSDVRGVWAQEGLEQPSILCRTGRWGISCSLCRAA